MSCRLAAPSAILILLATSGAVASGAPDGAAPRGPGVPVTGAPGTGAPALIERATTELVLIEVYATDGRGRPIRDLTAADFTLLVDGYAKPIHSLEFQEAVPAAPAAPGAPGESASLPAGPQRLPRRLILFFDDRTSATEGLTAARQATRSLLAGDLPADDQLALAAYDRKLRILHDYTTDRRALIRTIDASLHDPARFSDFAAEEARHEREMAELLARRDQPGASESLSGQLTLVALNYAAGQTPRARGVLRALGTLVDSLAPYPGHKGIVFMGDGVAENPAVDFLQRFAGRAPASMSSRLGNYDLSLEIKELAHRAAAAGVTLHSVQTSGLTSATAASLRATGRRSSALETLALNTGGTKSTSNDLLKGLAQAETAGRAYYVIGYVPDGPPDGQYHTVQVRLKRGAAGLRWRRGFTRLLPEQARARAVEAAYLLPELYPGLGVEITAVSGPSDRAGRFLDLVLHLPPGRAVFVPGPEGAVARLETGFVLIDGSLRETLRCAREARIRLAEPESAGEYGIDFFSRIRLPAGGQTITAVVFDRATGSLGAARLEIPPAPGPLAGGVVGLSIYSLAEKSLWIEVPALQGPPAPDEAVVSYEIGPALKTTFSVGEPLACGFRLEGIDPPSGLALAIHDGERDLRRVAVATGTPGAGDRGRPDGGSIKASLPVEGLAAGDYRVIVRRRDASGAERDAGSVPLRLRVAPGSAGDGAGAPSAPPAPEPGVPF